MGLFLEGKKLFIKRFILVFLYVDVIFERVVIFDELRLDVLKHVLALVHQLVEQRVDVTSKYA